MLLNLALSAVALSLLLTTGTAQTVKVALVGGPSPLKGRLEVYYSGRWGTVCDDYFTYAAARVVCYMLGYGHRGKVVGNQYGAGNGTIWLDNVLCIGTETSIADCQHSGWGRHNCGHYADVSVSCLSVFLVGGPNPEKGRLEVYHKGTWGTVCSDYFDDRAAGVVCYMLGYGYAGKFIGDRYGAGSGQILLDDIRCNGTETTIEDCRHSDWGVHDCGHDKDVSVSCTTVWLVGGPSAHEGRLQIHHNGRSANVCIGYIDNAVANVVCYMLGFGHVGHVSGNYDRPVRGRAWFIWNRLRCSGIEKTIVDCRQDSWHIDSNCIHVSVSCFSKVRLVGDSGSKGRFEVYHKGTWGTVCDNGFTDAAATVVCSMLGYRHTGRFIGNSYGAGSGAIWLENVQCRGRELYIHRTMCTQRLGSSQLFTQ